jgi:hypothetical protein
MPFFSDGCFVRWTQAGHWFRDDKLRVQIGLSLSDINSFEWNVHKNCITCNHHQSHVHITWPHNKELQFYAKICQDNKYNYSHNNQSINSIFWSIFNFVSNDEITHEHWCRSPSSLKSFFLSCILKIAGTHKRCKGNFLKLDTNTQSMFFLNVHSTLDVALFPSYICHIYYRSNSM